MRTLTQSLDGRTDEKEEEETSGVLSRCISTERAERWDDAEEEDLGILPGIRSGRRFDLQQFISTRIRGKLLKFPEAEDNKTDPEQSTRSVYCWRFWAQLDR